MGSQKRKRTSVKCPVLNFYGTKTFFFFSFSISNFSHCFLFFFFSSDVFVNGHLYVNKLKKKKKKDQELIDGLLENHVGFAFVCEMRPWEILPWLSFNLLISRLSTSLCMVFGHYCISLKMKSWREDSYCGKKKKKKKKNENYLLVLFLTNGYVAGETQTWSTHWGCGFRFLPPACICFLLFDTDLSAAPKCAKMVQHNMHHVPLWLD